ncbi:hypothetical protein EUTSA_v10026132mg [Eutrema salsugineum]|uniref:Rho termination factor-like N-terminal domain-containing protein n=1 Tax=Eutrema salsugineum TaxID=72664 RepID=V4P7H2_EUTSA|nr:uncharacterized protein LOC18030509 isoform X2 [Eutrema salsugineum]ESQ55516.1 hypothetical protein EUTSA_v10026132mg [Eutrema salsugineum]
MDLALHFPCVYPMIKQGFRRATHLPLRDSPSPSFGQSLSRTVFNGDRRSWPQEDASSSSSGRSKKGSVCCKKRSDERSSSPSKSKQEEIISLFRRIQSSISKGDSQGAEEKNRNGSSEREPLSKAILDVLEKPRKKPEGDTGVKSEPPKRQGNVARPPSSVAKRSPVGPSTSGPRELKEVAKKRGIKGYSKLKKSEILELLRSHF